MIHLIVVSHSPTLARGVIELAAGMSPHPETLHSAAGIDDPEHPIGTDAVKIAAVIEQADNPDGTLILVDLGSALLSTQTALDLVAPEIAGRCLISGAPLVEGAISAAIAAGSGANLTAVAREAGGALTPKQTALGEQHSETSAAITPSPAYSAQSPHMTVILDIPNGLHARPAARLAETLSPFHARLVLVKDTDGKSADPGSLNQIAALQTRGGDKITLYADGADSEQALQAFKTLADNHFGELLSASPTQRLLTDGVPVRAQTLSAPAYLCYPRLPYADKFRAPSAFGEKSRLQTAVKNHQAVLDTLSEGVGIHLGKDYGEIFAAQKMMLDELAEEALQILSDKGGSAAATWQQICNDSAAIFRSLDNAYLRERDADVYDLEQNILALLNNETPQAPPDQPHILVAEDIYPSRVFCLGEFCRAIILAKGSDCSHAALLLKALNVPLIIEAGERILTIENKQMLSLDLTTGSITY